MAARVLLARHGLADYETALVTDHGGSLSPQGRKQARALGRHLSGEGVAAVWSSPLSRAVQTAELAAGLLGVDVTVREGLREYGVGSLAGTDGSEREVIGPVFQRWEDGDDSATIPGGEPVADIASRLARVLTEIAERHDGETVLALSHGGAVMVGVPSLTGLPRRTARDLVLDGGGYVELRHDAGRWNLERIVSAIT